MYSNHMSIRHRLAVQPLIKFPVSYNSAKILDTQTHPYPGASFLNMESLHLFFRGKASNKKWSCLFKYFLRYIVTRQTDADTHTYTHEIRASQYTIVGV